MSDLMSRLYLTALFVICGVVFLIVGHLGLVSLPAFAEDNDQATVVSDESPEATPSPAQARESQEDVSVLEGPRRLPTTPLNPRAWNRVDTTGIEGELVETVFDADMRGWVIVGERGFGIGMYGAPKFQVPMRKWEDIPMFPCSDCHKKMEINYTPRKLKEKHADLVVDHGNDRFWCTACHDGKGMDFLASKDGRRIDMDHGYLHCGECHFKAHKDWEYGVHGLRIGMWKGIRVLRTCTECHDAHQPQTALETPIPAPLVRGNLEQFGIPVTTAHE